MSDGNNPSVIPVTEKLPPVNKFVIAVQKNWRCLGFVDEQGRWRNPKGEQLVEVMGWSEV